MGTKHGSASGHPDDEHDDGRESLGDAIEGILAEVDVDSVETVREVREDE